MCTKFPFLLTTSAFWLEDGGYFLFLLVVVAVDLKVNRVDWYTNSRTTIEGVTRWALDSLFVTKRLIEPKIIVDDGIAWPLHRLLAGTGAPDHSWRPSTLNLTFPWRVIRVVAYWIAFAEAFIRRIDEDVRQLTVATVATFGTTSADVERASITTVLDLIVELGTHSTTARRSSEVVVVKRTLEARPVSSGVHVDSRSLLHSTVDRADGGH